METVLAGKKKHRRSLRMSLLLAVVMTLVVAACGATEEATTSPDDAEPTDGQEDGAEGDEVASEECTVNSIYERIEGLEGEERAAELARISVEEENAHFTKYTNMTATDNEGLFDVLDDEYEIEPSVYIANSDPLMQRLQRELSADVHEADMFVASVESIEQMRLANPGIFAEFKTPYRDDVVEAAASSDYWVGHTVDVYVGAWNPTLVSADEVPETWAELADSRFADMIGMEASDDDWFATLVGYYIDEEGMSEEDAIQIFRDMASGASTYRGHSLLAELNAGGEFAIGTSHYLHLVARRLEAGADLEWEPPIQPIVISPDGTAILCQAQNPAGALLHAELMLSPRGQEIFVEQGREITNTAVEGGLLAQSPYDAILLDYDRVIGEQDKWKDLYDEIMGLGAAGD